MRPSAHDATARSLQHAIYCSTRRRPRGAEAELAVHELGLPWSKGFSTEPLSYCVGILETPFMLLKKIAYQHSKVWVYSVMPTPLGEGLLTGFLPARPSS